MSILNPWFILAVLALLLSVYVLGRHDGRSACERARAEAVAGAQGERLAAHDVVFGRIETRLDEMAEAADARQAREETRAARLAAYMAEIETHADAAQAGACQLTARDAELLNALDAAAAGEPGR